MVFLAYIIITNVVLVSVSEGLYHAGELVASNVVLRVALTLLGVHFMIFVVLSLGISHSLVQLLSKEIEKIESTHRESSSPEHSGLNTEMLTLTVNKIRQTGRAISVSCLVCVVYFFLLAHYQDFYVDLVCSKVFACLTLGFLITTNIFSSILFVVT